MGRRATKSVKLCPSVKEALASIVIPGRHSTCSAEGVQHEHSVEDYSSKGPLSRVKTNFKE